jgi:hypothetical protein
VEIQGGSAGVLAGFHAKIESCVDAGCEGDLMARSVLVVKSARGSTEICSEVNKQ